MSSVYSEEEKLLIKKAEDKQKQCYLKGNSTYTGFLNEREQDILMREIKECEGVRMVFYGGYSDAERRVLVFLAEYDEIEYDPPVKAIRAAYYKEYDLSHRDFLGSLMGSGIKRESVGDIIVNKDEHYADIVFKKEIEGFMLREFITAGRATLRIDEIPLSTLDMTEKKTETITDTVASARIDAVVASGFGMSREKASVLIKSGKVFLDRRLVTDCDKQVDDGSLVNAQGMGKFRVYIPGNLSKKGRMFLKIEKYV